MEEYKDALKSEFNDTFGKCPTCNKAVFVATMANKIIVCHGKTYADLKPMYEAKHAKLIAEMETNVKDAHNKYAASTISSPGNTSTTINASVQKLFNDHVYPTYNANKKVFDDAKADIGDINNKECIGKYNEKYNDVEDSDDVKAIVDEKARNDKIKKIHADMNQSIRASSASLDANAMVKALKDALA